MSIEVNLDNGKEKGVNIECLACRNNSNYFYYENLLGG